MEQRAPDDVGLCHHGNNPLRLHYAYRDLSDLPISFHPYRATAERVWKLRDNLTVYDASYVALAELLEWPFLTLDARLARAYGPRCEIITKDKLKR